MATPEKSTQLWRSSFRLTQSKPHWDFKNLNYIGDTPNFRDVKDDSYIMRTERSFYSQYLGSVGCERMLDIAGDTHALVQPRVKNVDKTIQSWDAKLPTSYEGETFHMALSFLHYQYGSLFSDPISTDEEISEAIDWSKSGGFPGTLFGLMSKDQLSNDDNWVEWMRNFDPSKNMYMPIWSAKPKSEVLASEDILNNKIRLFQIPPLHYLWYQHKYGLKSSSRMKNYKWSYYGFNPYRGGFDLLARRLLQKKWRLCYDVSGWDKFLPILREVYGVIKKNMNLKENEQKEFDYVILNLVSSMMRMPNGQVFEKTYGNPSGSGTTTRDNILAHIVIFSHALIEAHIKLKDLPPTMELLASQVVAIFGDDMVASVDEEFKMVCDFEFMSRHFLSYGMKLKFLFGGFDYPMEELSFLGAHFVFKDHSWLPLFNIPRLAFSVAFENTDKRCTLGQYVAKVRTLTFMSYPSKKFDDFCITYNTLLNRVQSFYLTGDTELDSMINLGCVDSAAVRPHFTICE